MPCWFSPPHTMWLLFVGKFETQFLLKTNHTSRKLGVQNQTTRQELLIFNSMYTIYQDGGYFQNLLFYVANLYYRNVTQRVVNAGSEWDSHSHVHPAQKMVNTKGVPLVTVHALGSSFTKGQTSSQTTDVVVKCGHLLTINHIFHCPICFELCITWLNAKWIPLKSISNFVFGGI